MKKNDMLWKSLVVGIFILFIGASIVPSISGFKTIKKEIAEPVNNSVTQNIKDIESLGIISHRATQEEIDQLKKIINNLNYDTKHQNINSEYATGFILPTEEDLDAMVGKVNIADGVSHSMPIPTVYDLSTEIYFPEVHTQGQQGSCVAWASAYYANGYMQAKTRGWTGTYNAQTSNSYDQLISPAFVYNKCKYKGTGIGANAVGSTYTDSLGLMETIGVCREIKMQYNALDYLSWGSENAWRDAPQYRIKNIGIINPPFSASDLTLMKTLLNNSHPLLFALDSSNLAGNTGGLGEDDDILENSEISMGATHAQCIVGYNDSKTVPYNPAEVGGFKIVNSWGKSWGKTTGGRLNAGKWSDEADELNRGGFYWITYLGLQMKINTPVYYFDIEYDTDESPSMIGAWTLYDNPGNRDAHFNMTIGFLDQQNMHWAHKQQAEEYLPSFMCLDVTKFYDDWITGTTDFHLVIGDSAKQDVNITKFWVEYYNESYNPGYPSKRSGNVTPTQSQVAIQGPTDITLFFNLIHNTDNNQIYTTFQDAIDDATSGDYLEVYPGVYDVNQIVINKPLTIIARDKDNTVIDGYGSFKPDGVKITADGVNLTGFTIKNFAFGNSLGIYSDNNAIIGNTIQSNHDGIYIQGSGNLLSNNNVNSHTNGKGIIISNTSFDNVVTGNTLSNNDYGIYVESDAYDNIIANNILFSHTTTNIYVAGFDNVIHQNTISASGGANGIHLENATANVVSGNSIFTCDSGVDVDNSNDNTITQNQIENNNDGITMTGSDGNTVYHNNLVQNGDNGYDDGTNDWSLNYPYGGNYWSDHSGSDTNNDGIIDNPKAIAGGAVDPNPFVDQNEWANQGYTCTHNTNSGTVIATPIQTAVNQASIGDKLVVSAGSYNQHVLINKTLMFIGSSKSQTSLYQSSGTVVDVTADDVVIMGFTLNTGGSSSYTLHVTSNNTVILGNLLRGFYCIVIDRGNNHIICNNDENNYQTYNYGSGIGILLWFSDNSIICENTARYMHYTGIYLYESNHNFVGFSSSADNQNGIEISTDCSNNTIYNNDAGKKIEYYPSIVWAGIQVNSNCNDNRFYGNYAKDRVFNGIILQYSDNNILKDNICIENNGSGIHSGICLNNCDGLVLMGNNASGNVDYGIYLGASHENALLGNIANNNGKSGIYLLESNNNTIRGNRCDENGDHGIYLWLSHYNKIISNILFNNSDKGIYLLESNYNEIRRNTLINNSYGIYLSNSNNNIIDDDYISVSTNTGVTDDNGDDNDITDNIIYNNGQGINIQGGSNADINGNTIIDNNYGINVNSGSSTNTIFNNVVQNSLNSGIDLDTTIGNDIGYNTIGGSEIGINMLDADFNNNIYQNTITGCNYGFYMAYSDDNQIYENTIKDNNIGFHNQESLSSGFGFIYNNLFVNNLQQAWDEMGTYQWYYDDQIGGNYWSDYEGQDIDQDGFGDTPYQIPPAFTSEDQYPIYATDPDTPYNPDPSNGETDVSVYTDLHWTGGDPDPGDTVTYDVYFGTNPGELELVSEKQTETVYNLYAYGPGNLDYSTKYYWQIIAKDSYYRTSTGPVWDFTTENYPYEPVAIWHFDENEGSIAYDSTENNNNGTINGATWTTGCINSGLYFHGGGQWHNGDGVTVPHSNSLDITNTFSIEAYIKATGTDSYLVIVDKYQYSGGNGHGFTFYLNDGKIRFSVYSGSDGAGNTAGTTDLRDNICHHVMGVWDGSKVRVFVDGDLENEADWEYPPASTSNNLCIGKRLSGHGGYMPFLGVIDEVYISVGERDEYLCGDLNNDDTVNIGDLTYIIAYLYGSGPSPYPLCLGDLNNDDTVNIGDLTYIIAYLYGGGSAPNPDCCNPVWE